MPIGLDTFDSAVGNPWSDMSRTIEDLESKSMINEKWPGRILAHGETKGRREAAKAMVNSLAYIMGVELQPSGRDILATACHKGISDGKTILREKYHLGDNLQALSAGIASRWRIVRGGRRRLFRQR
jgi:hypothetical protein